MGSRVISFKNGRLSIHSSRAGLLTETSDSGVVSSSPRAYHSGEWIREHAVRLDGDRAVISLDFHYSGKDKRNFEYAPLTLPPKLVDGAKFTYVTSSGKSGSGVFPMTAGVAAKQKMPASIKKIVFSTVFGELTIETLKGPALTLLDRRFDAYNRQMTAVLLISTKTEKLRDGEFQSEIAVTFHPAELAVKHPVRIPAAEKLSGRREVAPHRFPLLPVPKVMRNSPVEYRFAPMDRAVIPASASGRLARHIERLFGLKSETGNTAPERGIFIEIGDKLGVDKSPDGYTLDVTPNVIRITSRSERGAFYALQTLRALNRDGRVGGVSIRDWPDFELRGWHTIGNSGTLDFWGRMLEKVGAPMKINTFLLECQFVQWEKAGVPKNPRGMSKEDLKKLIQIAHENYIDFIPLLQSLSHCEWMFYGKSNLDMAEDVNTPYCYNASNPEVYDLLRRVYSEVFELFGHTEFFHIGHDEVRMPGHREFPVRPENVRRGIYDIFEKDTLWQYDYLRRHGKRTMMWHDMLVNPAELSDLRGAFLAVEGTEKLRKTLPKDIVMCVWNYRAKEPGAAYPEIDLFIADGFPVIGCTWFGTGEVGNIENFSRYCLGRNVLGMINTTWSHYGTETVLNTHFVQIAGHTMAAGCFWNVDRKLNGADRSEVLVGLLDGGSGRDEELEGVPFECNTLLDDPRFDFGRIGVVTEAGGVPFRLAVKDALPGALTGKSYGYPDFPERVSIPVGKRFDRLYLLHTILSNPKKSQPMCKVAVKYDDGSVEHLIIRSRMFTYGASGAPRFFDADGKTEKHGYEVFAPGTVGFGYRNSRNNMLEWSGRNGDCLRMWTTAWVNPHPDKTIRELEFSEFNPDQPYFLLGITGGRDITAPAAR